MIRYHPKDLLKKIAPAKKIEKLVSGRLTLNKSALSFVSDIDFLSKKSVQRVALNTINQYKEKFENLKDEGASASDAKDEALNDKQLLVDRVQNTIVQEVAGEIKDQYRGEFYKWLPSESEIPDPLHSLKYGKKYQIGRGEMPGERYGCKCGMQILVKETKLKL
jgi:hypothetical protein